MINAKMVLGGWLVGVVCNVAAADIVVPLMSYEPDETGVSVVANAGDAGLSIAAVPGGTGGVPAATDGSYVLEVTVAGEADGKVEFRHFWNGGTYDLAGYDTLLADVYVASAGALADVMGIWSSNWNPPNAWQPGTGEPTQTGVWTTVSYDVSQREQVGLDEIWAFVIEDMAGTSGVLYVDNLRLVGPGGPDAVRNVGANGYDGRNVIVWKPQGAAGLEGYNVYRSLNEAGPFAKLNASPVMESQYADELQAGDNQRYFYQVTSVVGGQEGPPSATVWAQYNGLTDDELLDMVQEATFRYFWVGAHPASKLSREGINTGHSPDIVTMGGTGFGLANIVVGAERGFVTRAAAATRVLEMLTFLEDVTPRYHGVWSHWYNGVTGQTIAFAGAEDNGGDLVETAFLVQGMLICRQYFDDPVDAVETEIRERVTRMWESVEWDWYRRYPGGDVLYWHWSPDYGWALNHAIRGYNEAQIIYLLAIASPTHPMPASSYYNGWAGGGYYNGNSYYGIPLWVGNNFGGPLFFTHYSNLGFDPRYKREGFANYYENARNFSLIHQAYAIDNPEEHVGYNAFCWGLTASQNPWGYSAHSPTNDNGTITPTAALSAMPYTPAESLAAMRHMLDVYGSGLWTFYGFRDAFHPGENWYSNGHLAIDQGPITVMIENYRSELCWRLFMQNPEIEGMMEVIGMYYEVDYDLDGDIDIDDFDQFSDCLNGPLAPPGACSAAQQADSDLNNDEVVDMGDVSILQRLFDPT
jgi:hypothetical protein